MNKETFEKTKLLYQTEADNSRHLFFKVEDPLLSIPHYHESIEIIYLLTGHTTAHIGQRTFKMNVGDICISNRYQIHFYEDESSETTGLALVIGKDYYTSFNKIYGNKSFINILRDPEKNAKIYNVMKEWLELGIQNELYNFGYSNILFATIIDCYGLDEGNSNESSEKAIQFMEYIHNNYSKEITLQSMAKDFGYSKEYFSTLFYQVIGQKFNKVLNFVRLQAAIEILKDSNNKNNKIEIILNKCGYKNQTTFYRHYKEFKNHI